jgi:hypothetical protein
MHSSTKKMMGSLGPQINTVHSMISGSPPLEKKMGSLGPQICTVNKWISGSLPKQRIATYTSFRVSSSSTV